MESNLELRAPDRIRELQEANEALRRSQQTLATELDTARRLQQVATDLIGVRGTQALYEHLLDTAVAIMSADFATLQRFYPDRGAQGELALLGYRGFNVDSVQRWQWVRATGATTCAEALRTGRRVTVPDVRKCDFMSGSADLQGYLSAGIIATDTTPLFSRTGNLLGMFSTQWREPHEVSAAELNAMDALARLAAALIERSRAEDQISESEAHFRNLADAAPVMIWVAGPDKGGTFYNKCCLDFTGRTMQDKMGDGWVAGLHRDDRDRFLEIYSSSIDARREFRAVFRLRRYDGEFRWVLCTGVPRFWPGDTFSGFIGSVIEINDQKLIEEGLRTSQLRLMAAQRLAKVGSWERRIGGEAIHWSDELLRILALPGDGPVNLASFLDHVHPKDREKILDVDGRVRSSDTPLDSEYRIVRPDGEVRFVRSIVEAIRDGYGAPVQITEAIQDITDQVRSREMLLESEHHLKNAERLARIGHWQWDVRTRCVSGSEEMYRIFGKPPDYVPSYNGFLDDLMPHERERMKELIRDSLERRVGHSVEYQFALPDGDLRTISCIWEVLLDDEGAPVRIFGTCQDITDSRRLQEESFARQKLESVGTLASGIAHDFNNLLGGVLAQADLALTECRAGHYPLEELHGIRNVAIRGSEIVRQLMIYAGRESAASGSVDISVVVKEMLELLKISISKRASLETELGRHLPAVRANAAQIRQIVMNLVTNASDAIGDREGVIRVNTQRIRSGDDDCLQLEVSDTGGGMSAETQAKMFDPFFTTKSAGRGLGLSVVQGVVRSLGGSILVASEPGGGATFQVVLPCARETAGETSHANPGAEIAPQASGAATLLVVEDERLLRQAVAKMLRKTGYQVLEAADGSSAVELLRASGKQIDAILLDLTIPGASGQEIVEEAAKVRPDMRVVLTSAYSQEMIAGMINSPQVRDFIRKPFRIEDLLKTLRNVL